MRLSELRAAISREGVSPGARAVWWAIASHADGDGNAWPSLAVIALMAGMSTRSVSANLRELEQAGMIETIRLPNHRNRYHVVHSREPQLSFPPKPTGSTLHADLKQASGRTGNEQRSDQPKRPLEVHKEGGYKDASTSPLSTGGSAATPLRGGGAECTSCRKPILFATLPSGRTVALDPEPDPSGTYALLSGNRVVELGVYQAAAADGDTRNRLHRRHDEICQQVAAMADLLAATRVNPWREESRTRKVQREVGR